MNSNKIWTIAGAESSGKTTLFNHCKLLLPDYQCVPELDRQWLENRNMLPPFDIDLLGTLFRDCLQAYQQIPFQHPTLLDTDLLNLFIWADHIQHSLKDELFNAWQKQEKRVYILCPPNIPYERDPLRTNEQTRNWVWQRHLELLKDHPCIMLSSDTVLGRWNEIKQILTSP